MLTIVFDLDGTLIDTAPDLIDTLNFILKQAELPPIAYETARMMIGGGAKTMIERALVEEGRPGTAAELDRLYAAFVAHYAEHIADRSRPFPHLEATLQRLAALGHQLAVCTNKLEWLSHRLLRALNLAPYFAAICGQDTFGMQKPDPRILLQTVARVGGEPAQSIMIGDSGTDVLTARAAGIPVIAVNFGYTEVPVAALNPDLVLGSFADLLEAIDRVRSTRR
jgi:phosphoglycolate phosphatase